MNGIAKSIGHFAAWGTMAGLLAAGALASATARPTAFTPETHGNPILAAYSEDANAKTQIQRALQAAGQEHKRVLVVFGANWCPDCRALDAYFQEPENARLLRDNYKLVEVNVGRFDKNLDIVRKYGVPLKKGIPALVVLNQNGRVVYAQRNGKFADMHKLGPDTVTTFLEKWKPASHRGTKSAM